MKQVWLIILILLSGCGAPATQQRAAVNASTATARQPAPNMAAAPGRSEPILADDITFSTYTHAASRRFSIPYPNTWQYFEQPDGVIFIDPSNRAGYSVFFSQAETDLQTYALAFVEANFGQDNETEILSQTDRLIRFRNNDTNLGMALNELSFLQHGETVYLVLITVNEVEWDSTANTLRNLIGGLTFKDLPAATPSPTKSDEPPLWALYGHPSENFGFLYPDTWSVSEADHAVEVTAVEYGYTFSVAVLAAETDEADIVDLEAYLQTQLDQLTEQHETFAALPITAYQAGQAEGYTVDYLYTDEAGIAFAGSIIATAIDDKLYHITLDAPAVLYDDALSWFNPMMQSFKILPPE